MPKTRQGKILLVDDSPSITAFVSDALTDEGYTVFSAQNGAEALEVMKIARPDLIISDVSMPVMNGFELVKNLKEHPETARIPVIMLTGETDESHVIGGLALGAEDYIKKPFSPKELAVRVNAILGRTRDRNRIQDLFSRYVSAEVVGELLKQSNEVALEGEERYVGVLFGDIRGFTALSQATDARRIVTLLNMVLSDMSEAIFGQHGTVDKYLGDGVMAVFGAPLQLDEPEKAAAQAALEIQERVRQFNATATEWELPQIQAGIGISFGRAVVGSIGSARRLEYTTIGPCVNTASRLEGLAGPGQILVCEATYAKIKDAFACRELPPVEVKGFAQPLRVYAVTGAR